MSLEITTTYNDDVENKELTLLEERLKIEGEAVDHQE
jgi:hypothetical protein